MFNKMSLPNLLPVPQKYYLVLDVPLIFYCIQVQQLNKGKDITSALIIDKLSQYTTEDTYGDSPPKTFMSINGLTGKASSEDHAKHHSNKNGAMKIPDEIPFASASHNQNDLLPEAKLRKYIDRYGLSGVLSKTGMPDMMTLYKKLSKDEENKVSPEMLRKIGAKINHRYHQHEIKKLKHEYSQPITIEYDHVVDETSNHDWSNTDGEIHKGPVKMFEAHWSPPQPINRNIQNQMGANTKSVPIDKALNSDGILPQTSSSFTNNNVNFQQQQQQQTFGNKGDLHWQMYRGFIGKQPSNVDNTRRDNFPGNPSGGYGYLGDSQQSYVDYSQIFPNSLKRKRRAVVGDEKDLRDFFFENDDSPTDDSPSAPSDDDYINVIGTAELQQISSKANSLKQKISVKAYPSEIRSPSFNYKFDTTGYGSHKGVAGKQLLRDRSFSTYHIVPERKADDFHFLVTKQRTDATNLEEVSNGVKSDNKVKTKAESSAKLSNNLPSSLSANHSKVEAEVSVQKCDKLGQCETINHPDNNPDTFHSKAGSSVVNEHELSRPLSVFSPTINMPEVSPQHQVDFQPPTGLPLTARPPTLIVTKPLPPPPDSELPVDDESDIEPEHAITTPKPYQIKKIKKPTSKFYKAHSSVQIEHGGNSHSVQKISVSAETPTVSDSQSKEKTHSKNHSLKISNEVMVKTDNKCCEGSQHLISITVVNKTIPHHSGDSSTKPPVTTPKIKHPAEIEKIEVEKTPAPITTTTITLAATPTTSTTPTTTSITATTTTTSITTTTTTTTAAPVKQPGLFIYDRKTPATESASMLGGDILLVVDITEELLVHAQKQDDAVAIQEVEVMLLYHCCFIAILNFSYFFLSSIQNLWVKLFD